MTQRNHKLRREQQMSRSDTKNLHIRVTGSVLAAFDQYAQKVAKERKRAAVSRSITFERLVFDAKKSGLFD